MKITWIIGRRTTIFKILVDYCINIYFYYYLFQKEFDSYPIKIVPILYAFFWIILSYIFGRYVKIKNISFVFFAKSFFKVAIIFILCNIIYLFINLFFPLLIYLDFSSQNLISIKLSSVFLKISLFAALISFFFQTSASILNHKTSNNKHNWIYYGNENEYKKILEEIKFRDNKINLEWISEKNDIQDGDFENKKGIIIEDFKKISDKNSSKIFDLKLKGFKVENLLNWFEKEFQRIPTNIVKDKYQLSKKIYSFEDNYQLRIKRIIDIIFSLILLIITSPFSLIISILIFIEDKGPIFYSQIRTGINGKRIQIIKFRSMKIDSEKDGVQWSQKFDPRITKIGRIIRSTRLDEIPQLFCVIGGSMSLIGPRPERPEIEKKFLEELAFYNLRYILKPGLSGWAQVNYRYGASVLDTQKKLSYDIFYISHFSIFLDLLIFFKTIKLVMNARGSQPHSDS